MVNTEEFAKRLNKILEFYELSAAAFADKVEVGRSSISHIVSGRNKPSLDFVMKIVKTFPEVELYWLLNGKGNFPAETETPSSTKKQSVSNLTSAESIQAKQNISASIGNSAKQISRIVIFYTDGSFDAFEN